jgi:hypothetical protein
MELGSYFLFLQEQIKDIIIISAVGAADQVRMRERLTIWSGCPAHAKEKTGRGDPRLTIFVRGPTDVDPKVGDPRLTQRGPRVDLRLGVRHMPRGLCRPSIGGHPHRRLSRRRASPAPFFLAERECCLLVLNLVSSTLPCIRPPRQRLRVLDVRGFV